MTRNDYKVSARRLANDVVQLKGRQRSLVKLSGGSLKEKWRPEFEALQEAINLLTDQVNTLQNSALSADGQAAEHLGMLNTDYR